MTMQDGPKARSERQCARNSTLRVFQNAYACLIAAYTMVDELKDVIHSGTCDGSDCMTNSGHSQLWGPYQTTRMHLNTPTDLFMFEVDIKLCKVVLGINELL